MKETIIITLVVIATIVWVAIWGSKMEAKSYNKFCDTPVTWQDAFFLDLRIDECNNQ